jgi:lipopolysaccharide export system permease protein
LLPLSLLLAVMLTMGRLYRDSEMSALRACGIGELRLYRPVLMVAVPIAALLTVLSLYVSPWTAQLAVGIARALESEAQLTAITPGRFIEVEDGKLMFFVESIDSERNLLERVFIHSLERGRTIIETAATASLSIQQSGERIIRLHDGNRYEATAGRGDFHILSFATHAVRIPTKRPPLTNPSDRDTLPTAVLWRSSRPDYVAELQWRLSVPISAILLALLAVPLSYTAPRQGRFGKLALGVAIYIFYANLGRVAVNWVERSVMPMWPGIGWVHLVLLALVGTLLIRQYGLRWSAKRLLARKSHS